MGHTVKHRTTDEYGVVQTYYDDGDLLVLRRGDGALVRWPAVEVLGLGRR